MDNEAQNKNENTNSYAGKVESCSSLQSTTRNSSFDSLQNMEGLSNDAGHFLPRDFDHPNEACRSKLPKILFADWLYVDQFHDFGNSSEAVVSTDAYSVQSGVQLHEGSFGSDTQQALSDVSADGMSHAQLKFEDQILENGFVDFISADNMCIDFNMINDVMYDCDALFSDTPSLAKSLETGLG